MSAWDALTVALVSVTLLVVAGVASAAPALCAARVSPTEALRAEWLEMAVGGRLLLA